MRKIKTWWIVITVILLIPVISSFNSQLKIDALEKDLKNYLIYVENYKETDIASIEGKKSKMPKYAMFVVFTDEPGITYVYTDRGIGKWVQLNSFPSVSEHLEK